LSMEKEGDLTDNDIRDEVGKFLFWKSNWISSLETFMFEGHDTTSSGMAWTLWASKLEILKLNIPRI
jgi:hypothetical protein